MISIGRFSTRTCQGPSRREFLRFGAAAPLALADGSSPRNLTRHAGRVSDPAWHPGGRQLAFVSDRSGQSEIYLMEVEFARPTGSDPR